VERKAGGGQGKEKTENLYDKAPSLLLIEIIEFLSDCYANRGGKKKKTRRGGAAGGRKGGQLPGNVVQYNALLFRTRRRITK